MVSYDGNENTGGAPPQDPAVYRNGAEIMVKGNPNAMTRTGYVFACWSTQPNGGAIYSESSFTSPPAIIVSDTTFYAVWVSTDFLFSSGCLSSNNAIIASFLNLTGFDNGYSPSGAWQVPDYFGSVYLASTTNSTVTSLSFGSRLLLIEGYAFIRFTGLTDVTIPESIMYIGDSAFKNWSFTINGIPQTPLDNIYMLKPTPPSLGSTAFPSDAIIHVPQGSVAAYQAATNWSAYTIVSP
jgi:hypothetical protein